MKRTIGILLVILAAAACKLGVDYKTKRDEVMKFHDVVMADQGVVVNNQMKLDTLLKDLKGLKAKFPEIDTTAEKATITALIAQLTKAEDSMDDWMHKFEPDVTGKSNEAAIQYFKDEMVKIVAVDSLYKKEIRSSAAYLSKFGK
ncbi:hypothetical protein [Pedobacter heparinus]|uniref:Viral A-type inclusion protein n=1 Tax=Pedobacter heparinus (strain ATCC 13125 / DSM 2366 / CIP 104194 / JCM 7457 / NBRC 12017 / NCIMB 9290 / NRRL B-14731 / HIM 762-3) TaxID=485917 RepID=C6XZK4_PEDHD|nr:hypothetical protein [Pedobacter heparinus]ACU04700.1 hypothetical protein Phep_2496 [Pedobacter heparinus DSM 2366]